MDLNSTVEPAERQVFLCCRGSESDPIPKLLSAAFKARQEAMPITTDLIICKEIYGSEFSDGNILILPERIKYRNLKESDIDSFVEHVLVHNQPLPSGVEELIPGYHILVCTYGSGTAISEKFTEEAEMRGLTVSPCSQTGVDKYKGSIIVYTAGPNGSISGHWYGEVTPEDVEDLFNECFGFSVMNKEIREQLLRSMRSEDDAPYEDDSPSGAALLSYSLECCRTLCFCTDS